MDGANKGANRAHNAVMKNKGQSHTQNGGHTHAGKSKGNRSQQGNNGGIKRGKVGLDQTTAKPAQFRPRGDGSDLKISQPNTNQRNPKQP